MSVVNMMPTELLCKIFQLCVSDVVSTYMNVASDLCKLNLTEVKVEVIPAENPRSHYTNDCPWTIPKVCQRWRNISLSFPELWTNIVFIIGGDNETLKESRLIDRLHTQLERAASQPLSVMILCFAIGASERESHPYLTFLHILFQRSSQIVRLAITATVPGFLQIPAVRQVQTSFPNLASLSIMASPSDFDEAPHFILSNSTKLKDLAIHALASVGLERHLPLSQVQNFQATWAMDCIIMPFLPHLASLHSCQLYCLYHEEPTALFPVRLPYLADLTVFAHMQDEITQASPETDPIAQILRHLELPGLRSLKLSGPVNIDVLLALQARSNFDLQDLAINSIFLAEDECFHLLSNFPTIRTISLNIDIMPNMTFEALLSQKHGDAAFLPKLETVTLTGKSSLIDSIVEAPRNNDVTVVKIPKFEIAGFNSSYTQIPYSYPYLHI
ncbi:hypothetical protein C8J56DRAFT_1162554 [Mycena floridula]|nr:hypothetical protein C8J56DRAFT_1162554 [Mycena floridula]